jgi:hypothetical protein
MFCIFLMPHPTAILTTSWSHGMYINMYVQGFHKNMQQFETHVIME